jgi:hypothetical protein
MMEATSSQANSMAANILWDEKNWIALTRAINYKKCILLLGPDAAMEEVEGGKFRPCTDILANELATDIKELLQSKRWNIDTNDLPQVSQYYKMNYDRYVLEEKVTSFYAARNHLTSPLHKNLAQLPFYLIITSTWDKMFVNACALAESSTLKKPIVEFFNFNRPGEEPDQEKKNIIMGTIDRPLIYQLYGGLQDPESMAITENDLLSLLVNVISGATPLPANILSELTSRDKSLLFLGFGFRHWYLRLLLHLIKIGSKDPPSFALERIGPQGLDNIRETNLFIENQGGKIQIFDKELNDFVEELVTRYNQKFGPVPTDPVPVQVPWIEPPTVFISYVRENENTVSTLQKKLKEAQFDVRIDRDILDPGVKWSQKIDEFISQVDYFIFLLSQDLVQQHETPAYHELREALKRQGQLRGDVTFVIPVKIDNCNILPDLQSLHVETIDLQEDTGVDKIVQAIKRDFQRRKAQGYAA